MIKIAAVEYVHILGMIAAAEVTSFSFTVLLNHTTTFILFLQPIQNYNEWRIIYFISFLLLVGFFVLNMFVGVVVENFHKCRESQEKEEKARRAEKRAQKLDQKRRSKQNLNISIFKIHPKGVFHERVKPPLTYRYQENIYIYI